MGTSAEEPPSPPPPLEWDQSSSDGEEPSPSTSISFDRDRHVAYLEMMYQMLPAITNRKRSIAHSRLLHHFRPGHARCSRSNKDAVASWVLSFQAHPGDKNQLNNGQFYGFQGSRSSQFPLGCDGVLIHNLSHLASTYCALATLKTVGYNLSNVDSKSILTSMRNLQQPDGSFLPIHIGAETDLRFVYCAVYDGGFGMVPGSESHGGGTYCAVASLRLMGFMEDDVLSTSGASSVIDLPLLLEWCLQRQAADGGFQGRPNKPSDTCYAFWVGAVLRILGGYKLIDGKALREFLITCQSKYGGFGKFPGELPDIYHSYYGCTAFSLLEEPGLNSLSFELGITDVAALGI
ncbi:hypothetical protein GH714_010374 [Hevea brasiliensis]|uniref:Prenyltransferase alpha-alpha toroid domain-containing protein n=1 Tax=Hevea brasiliensis TaxID=3981 RepID=A0A6A6N2M8_HEVBR|nr:hypothetical protein GH714_010374 [Hevea brasiliensis]